MKYGWIILLLVALGWSQSGNATMTLYKDGFALIKQPVGWQVPAGFSVVRYDQLPNGLFADSPFLNFKKGISIQSQRLDENVFSGELFFRSKLGKQVEIKTEEGESIEGLLLEYTSSTVTIQEKSNVKSVKRNKIDFISVKDRIESPQFKPVLVWEIYATQPGETQGELVYMSSGFGWNAVYRLIIAAKVNKAELIPEAFVSNNSNVDFSDLQLQLVEGSLHRVGHKRVRPRGDVYAIETMAFKAQAEPVSPAREALGDYHIYSLPKRLTFKGNESITVRLYDPREITFEKTYLFENNERSQREEPLIVELKIENSDENKLNIPLPAGKIEMYQSMADGSMEFVGEDRLKQIPKGGTAKLTAGRAFDVTGKRKVLNYDRRRKSEEASIEIQVKNTRDNEIQVRVIEHITGDWVIRDASDMYIKEDASTIYFPLTIPPDKNKTVTYTYRKEWK